MKVRGALEPKPKPTVAAGTEDLNAPSLWCIVVEPEVGTRPKPDVVGEKRPISVLCYGGERETAAT